MSMKRLDENVTARHPHTIGFPKSKILDDPRRPLAPWRPPFIDHGDNPRWQRPAAPESLENCEPS